MFEYLRVIAYVLTIYAILRFFRYHVAVMPDSFFLPFSILY